MNEKYTFTNAIVSDTPLGMGYRPKCPKCGYESQNTMTVFGDAPIETKIRCRSCGEDYIVSICKEDPQSIGDSSLSFSGGKTMRCGKLNISVPDGYHFCESGSGPNESWAYIVPVAYPLSANHIDAEPFSFGVVEKPSLTHRFDLSMLDNVCAFFVSSGMFNSNIEIVRVFCDENCVALYQRWDDSEGGNWNKCSGVILADDTVHQFHVYYTHNLGPTSVQSAGKRLDSLCKTWLNKVSLKDIYDQVKAPINTTPDDQALPSWAVGCHKIIDEDEYYVDADGVFKSYYGDEARIILPDGITSVSDDAFWSEEKIEAVVIPDGVRTVGDSAFRNCANLKYVYIPDSVTSIGDSAFEECGSLVEVRFPDSVESIGTSAFRQCVSLTEIHPPENLLSVGNDAFNGCPIQSFKLPQKLRSIGSSAFDFGDGTPDFRTETPMIPASVNEIGDWPFSSTEVIVERGSFAEKHFVQLLEDDECSYDVLYPDGERYKTEQELQEERNAQATHERGLKAAQESIQADLLALSTDLQAHFTAMKDVDISKCKVSSNHGLMKYNGQDTQLILPASVTWIGKGAFAESDIVAVEIPEGVGSIAQEAFHNCSKLQSVKLPSTLKKMGFLAFGGCRELNAIDIPDSCTEIDTYAFSYCDKLTALHLPAKLKKLGERAFGYCKSLKTVVIPDGCVELSKEVFIGCKLNDIYIPSSVKSIGENVFGGYPQDFPVVHTPKGSQAEAYAKSNGIKVDNIL